MERNLNSGGFQEDFQQDEQEINSEKSDQNHYWRMSELRTRKGSSSNQYQSFTYGSNVAIASDYGMAQLSNPWC